MMARVPLTDDQKLFLSTLRRCGGSAGNTALRTELGWRESRYWKVHAALLEVERIVKGRGRGGSVHLA